MTIHLPARAGERPAPEEGPERTLDRLTPRQIVAALDRDVVGQQDAKRAVAIALRNRIRRQRLAPRTSDREVGADEVTPKNIILIGPTGVGKTEIARRLARLSDSPFVKVEASKFTEVGYVGRDVESMIRDLVETGVDLVRNERQKEVRGSAERATEERLLALLLPSTRGLRPPADPEPVREEERASFLRTREKLREKLRAGELEESVVEVEVQDGSAMPVFRIWTGQGMEEMNLNLKESLPGLFGGGGKGRKRKMTVAEAREHLRQEEEEKLIDPDQIARQAVERVEQSGIVFLDEIDKIAGREGGGQGPDVSREGVQRDLLPIVEGTTVNTKYGRVRTDHILFIASGAFHMSKPSDLIPELQGRFPIRVELEALEEDDFVRILMEPRGALTKQYIALLRTEGVELRFTEDGVRAVARFAAQVNETSENIGARRLHTLMERLLKDILFDGADLYDKRPVIDAARVEEALRPVLQEAKDSSGRIGFSPLSAAPTGTGPSER